MIHNKFSIQLSLVLTLLTCCSVFAQYKKVKFGETFTLLTDDAVKTEDNKLKIQSKGVGRSIADMGEAEYVELLVSWNGSEQKVVISERGQATKTVGGYVIKLVSTESFGTPACQLKVLRKRKGPSSG